jgi:hypothetical protein
MSPSIHERRVREILRSPATLDTLLRAPYRSEVPRGPRLENGEYDSSLYTTRDKEKYSRDNKRRYRRRQVSKIFC